MAETAAGGGCLTVDVRDPNALADAMITLADSGEYRDRLAADAGARRVKTWEEYATEILAHLSNREANVPDCLLGVSSRESSTEEVPAAAMPERAEMLS